MCYFFLDFHAINLVKCVYKFWGSDKNFTNYINMSNYFINKQSIIIKIKSIYNQLTKTNKLISDFLINNPHSIYDINLKEMSSEVKVSEASIIKFCRLLGLKGFTDLKLSLIKEISLGLDLSDDNLSVSLNSNSISNYLLKKDINNLTNTINNLDFYSLDQAIDKILKAKKIILVAVGSSFAVAYDFFCRISRIKLNCLCCFDYENQRISCTHAEKSDVVIGISLFGESFSVVSSLKIAKKKGVTTIGVTSFLKSSITKYSDIKLFTVSLESEFQKIDIPSRLSQMLIFDIIYLNIALRLKEKSIESISRAENTAFLYKKLKKEKF